MYIHMPGHDEGRVCQWVVCRTDFSRWTHQGVFTLGDAQSFSGLTSKLPPLGAMLNFDADVKK